jgi:hypothetical protein
MSSKYEAWARRPVNRDHLGRFAESAASHAARLLADAAVPGRAVSKMFREGARPEGFEHLAGRAAYLSEIPAKPTKGGLGRPRTDEEHEEMELIEAAVEKYYDSIGLNTHQYSYFRRSFTDAHEVYNPYGEAFETKDPDAPRAAQLGYKFLGKDEDGDNMWAKPGVSPYREVYSDSGRLASMYGTPYQRRPSVEHKDFFRTDGRTAVFARNQYGDQVDMYTRQMSKPGKEGFGGIGGRGNKETDFRAVMKYVDPKLNKRLREGKGKKKRSRTWIEKLDVRMQRGEV